MEKERSDANLNTKCFESPGSALLERLRNLRKWQDEQCKELRDRQFIKETQTKALADNENEENMNSGGMLEHQMASSPIIVSSSKVETVLDLTKEQVTIDKSPALPKDKLRKAVMINERSHMTNYDNIHMSTASTSFVGSFPAPTPSTENSSFHILTLCHHDGAYIKENKEIELRDKLCDRPSFTPPVFQSSDMEVLLPVLEHVDKKRNNGKLLRETKLDSKVSSPKYENDDTRKLHGLSNFIKHHASVGGPANAQDLETLNGSESPQKPKFTFLRKGQGTSRFGMKHIRLKSKLSMDNNNIGKSSEKPEEKLCKNPDYMSTHKISPLKSKSVNISPKTYQSRIANRPVQNLQLQKGCTKKGASEPCSEVRNYEKSKGYFGDSDTLKTVSGDESQQVFTLGTVDYEKQGRKELEELSAFEKLEELAEDSSFSSNCSTVVQLLRLGQHSASSTPVRSQTPTPRLMSNFMLMENDQDNGNHSDIQESLQRQFPLVSVSQILEQLKGIVRLEYSDESQITQEELRTLIESFADSDTTLPSECISYFANNIQYLSCNATSTPAIFQEPLPPRPRVHFRPEGVEVLEYECSDTDEENTLTETPSIVDDTDLVTTSDLEILAGFDAQLNLQETVNKKKFSSNKCQVQSNDLDVSSVQDTPRFPISTLKEKNKECLQPLKLQFSPPPRYPQNSASHYIWSIFGKEKEGKTNSQPKNFGSEPVRMGNSSSKAKKDVKEMVTTKTATDKMSESNGNQQDVETYKALLMAKVFELEKETESFKKENQKLKVLQESLQCERDKLERERKAFQIEMDLKKKKFCEYLDFERNKLWKEKQAMRPQSPSALSVREQSVEIVYLKEQLDDRQENYKKKESLHLFTEKKLNEKIKAQEEEIKTLKEKNMHLQNIEKQNLYLKHEIDRAKLSGKLIPKNKTNVSAPGNSKMKAKRVTINSINKSLDKASLGNIITTNKMVCRPEPEKSMIKSHKCSKANMENSQENQESNVEKYIGQTSVFQKELEDVFPENKINVNIIPNCLQGHEDTEIEEGTYREQYIEDKASLRSLDSVGIDYTELCKDDGTKEIIYSNGNKKELYPDGSITISYYNGDRKEIYDDRTVYVYGTDSTRHTTYSDGKEILEFPNGQKETRFSDGSSEIIFTDNTRKTMMPDGTEICVIKDGTIVRTNSNGIKVFEFASGQKEVHTPEEKRREYPDGTIKILHQDGRTETRYKKGRVRIKDKEGNILIDTHQSVQ